MKLSIIILSFNTKALLLRCVKSIADKYKDNLSKNEMEIIVVDNDSTDGSVDAVNVLISRIKNLCLIVTYKNLGFSKGNNYGTREAKGEYLLFLNSDTEIKDNAFFNMVNFLSSNPKIGILGAKLTNEDGSAQKSAGNFYSLFYTLLSLLGLERLGLVKKNPRAIVKVDWVSGAALMVKSDLFRSLKGFDEKIFMYMEDVDLCFRAKRKGYQTYFYPDINIVHKGQGSSNRAFAINRIYQGLLYFYKKHKPYWQYFIVKIMLIVKAVIAVFIGTLVNNTYLRKTYFGALKVAI